MSSQLDPSILAAITEEARQCFLDEDAPEYLEMLEIGLQEQKRDRHTDFTMLLRAAHSLKGGAGLASLSNLQHLAHKLEDVLVGIQQGKITEVELGWALVERSVDEIASILSQARTEDNVPVDLELISALEELVGNTQTASDLPQNDNSDLVRTTLSEDLEATFNSIEAISNDTPANSIAELLSGFVDECQFLSETLDLPWLAEATVPISMALETSSTEEVLELAKEIVVILRSQRDAYLNNASDSETALHSVDTPAENSLIIDTLKRDLEASLTAIEELSDETPLSLIQQLVASFNDECLFWGETLNLPWLIEATAPLVNIGNTEPKAAFPIVRQVVSEIRNLRDRFIRELDVSHEIAKLDDESAKESSEILKPQPANPQIRVPAAKLEDISNRIEELILIQSRLARQQKLLGQARYRLRALNRQFEPIQERIRDFYDRLALSTDSIANIVPFEQIETTNTNDLAFDSLELDRYTELHTSLQSFQESILLIQETAKDIDLIERELSEDLESSHKNLDALYNSVNQSRLVPFQLLAKRFVPQIQSLNRRFNKSIDLKIVGEHTPIDRVLLEQLQTPLTHLINNACDHGIESTAERLASNKSETARITLEASVKNDRLVITVVDDGSGINLEKVYYRALERGICTAEHPIEQFQDEEIVNWIFEPDFSTAAEVSDISGRGMGLDIVRSQIRQLKGDIKVKTTQGKGTTFTINLPLNLSWRSLLLVRLQNQIIAIPNTDVLEILLYKELEFSDVKRDTIIWKNRTIPIDSLAELLPCPRQPLKLNRAEFALVLETASGLAAILVEALVKEEKLIVKPFDETISVPAYLSGCTVLATGQVVPVLLAQSLPRDKTVAKIDFVEKPFKSLTILVAEDSVATRRMLEKVLSAVGYQVIVCRDGQEALDRLERDRASVDLILSDVEMPRLNGFELLRKVRSHDVYQTIPVVMVTSRIGDRHRQQAIDLGATNYLGKPIQPQELLATIEALEINSQSA